jgi:hypothetical protein
MWFGKPSACCATLTVVLAEPRAEIMQVYRTQVGHSLSSSAPDECADPESLPGQWPVAVGGRADARDWSDMMQFRASVR